MGDWTNVTVDMIEKALCDVEPVENAKKGVRREGVPTIKTLDALPSLDQSTLKLHKTIIMKAFVSCFT